MPSESSDPADSRAVHAAAAGPPGDGQVYAPPREAAPAEGPDDARRGTPWTLTTYFAEGLPFSIVHQISAELFTSFGASLSAVSYTSLYGLAWNFKFVWSPLVDRYGTLRRWIVGTELLVAVVMAAVAARAGRGDIQSVALALVAVSFLGATQDIAVDGYYIGALDKPAQASLAGTRVAAYRVALLVGKSGLVALAGFTSWRVTFLAAAGMLAALALAHQLLLRPLRGSAGPAPAKEEASEGGSRQAGRSAPARAPARDAAGRAGTGGSGGGAVLGFVDRFRTFLTKPKIAATIAFILLFKAGDALLFNMSAPFLKSLGLDTDMRGVLSAPSLIASVAGTVIGGVWIRRTSLARTLAPIAFLQAVAIPLYTALALARPSFAAIAIAVGVEQLIAGLGNAALLVFLMRRAEGPHKTAHFAIGTALMTVPTTLAGIFAGHLAESLGFPRFFVLAFLLAVPGALLARHVPKD